MSKIFDLIFVRDKHVCPWWLCFTFDNIFRKLIHDPVKILGPYIKEGDTILDIGPGMGYFTVPMAKIAGENGRVTAIDLQEKMLAAIKKRAQQAQVDKRITFQLCSPDSLGVKGKADFILAFWMVHEVPDKPRFLTELFLALKDKGTFLLAEPVFHVTKTNFEETVQLAVQTGFALSDRPKIMSCRSALFTKLSK
jgi:ubiquinone/menaquinone biosynthesis C-methylase UbiE